MELQQIGMGHPAVKHVLSIQNNTAPNRFKLLVAEGLWENNVVLDTGLDVDTFFWCPELIHSDEARKRSEELAERAGRPYRVSEKTLLRMAERGNPDGIISLARMPEWHPDEITLGPSALVLVTDGIEIPGNLGTLIRTLDACRADLLIMTNRRTRMSHPKVVRGSQGMSVRVPHLEFTETGAAIAWLKDRGFTVYLADTDESVNYRRADYRGRTAFVVGSERYGVSKPWYEHGFDRLGVPMLGYADSLNVSVSASILLYEARAQKARW
ncbi:TrmH family RNA methyltransferase [Rhizohabitans arisaemae]|uniref:TrmH family RNA methyltransferase n=1 Tax=Rhizohabitans arisaemae TaxID=2720610 RepID=UPI0024B26962|nr:RNA methyltransferase [Rhizohabitans arisaemae]